NSLPLVLKDATHGFRLVLAAFHESAGRSRSQFLAAFFQVRQQLGHVARSGVLEQLEDRGIRRLYGLAQRFFEQTARLAFGVASIRGERRFAYVRIDPASGHGDQFLVQSGSSGAVQAETAQQDNAPDGVGSLRQAGARQVVVNEPLGDESPQQA